MKSFNHTGKTECKIDTKKPRTANGKTQYPTALRNCKIDLYINMNYPLLPSNLQFIDTKTPPIQKSKNTFIKSS